MILYKTIALQYGRFLETGQPGKEYDPVGRMVPTEETRAQRRGILDDLSAARLYLLDHRAANYLDSLRMDVQGKPWEERPESHIQSYVSEIEFPQALVWVEYDSKQLWQDRVTRGLTSMSAEQLQYWHQRGFLFDNRAPDFMTVRLFSAMTDQSFWDAPLTLVLPKSPDGRPSFEGVNWQAHRNVAKAHMQMSSGNREQEVRDLFKEHKGHLSYEMVIGFMLFAALAAREDDLISRDAQSLSNAEIKTARKFGKSWITESPRSHVTIRIGPSGERHLAELERRQRFEEAQASGRATPTEHWVAEHERRYASGKVVKVRAHKRGQPTSSDLPVRVVGPRPKD
ncbi:hypothetical protein [Litoreibacter roseus]|uniref:Uncharacterized protein n=1 Tax=Litoreibacter roseus TaxID=2601869 RepID=A0A6N6JLB8_9RHOB|nr:hypothetical protein [Litoreibacter roseus]GFE67103.1 hypothetical protein KIN_41770 [Litoreibacter roseus]